MSGWTVLRLSALATWLAASVWVVREIYLIGA